FDMRPDSALGEELEKCRSNPARRRQIEGIEHREPRQPFPEAQHHRERRQATQGQPYPRRVHAALRVISTSAERSRHRRSSSGAKTGFVRAFTMSRGRGIISRQSNTDVILGIVTGIDVAERAVLLGKRRIPYDQLVIATGARESYFGHDEWAAVTL